MPHMKTSLRSSIASLPVAAFISLVGIASASPAQDAAAPNDASARSAKLDIHLDQPAKPISRELFGIFFEDLNHAADGGLYAELVRNRSFEFTATENPQGNQLTGWELVLRGDARGSLDVDAGRPLNANNPHYAVLNVERPGEGVGIANDGFDGIAVREGASYNVALFVRQLYAGARWSGDPVDDRTRTLTVRLEDREGALLGETTLDYRSATWVKLTGTIVATGSADNARLIVLAKDQGGVGLDIVSLFPQDTFRGRANGLRRDLAETIAALYPRFVRFPGGCLVHGNGIPNFYRWQDTVGPIEQRREQENLWGYHQSVGLGYFEFFQFCEDIGAVPLPVVPAAVSCQHSGHAAGRGQEGVPLADMPAYIADVLNLIEWANGPVDSIWGAKRAAAGHPTPFGLKYLGIGNEDAQTPAFRERFRLIYDAVHAKHPEITLIGTVGPFADGEDFDAGWAFANELNVPVVDEHYYQPPNWFVDNLARYNSYNRDRAKVYLGEFASKGNTLDNALAEAAYMTALERNADIVRHASYAPLLAKIGRTQWNPDLIYFTNTRVFPTVNYHVQQMFGANQGDAYPVQTLSVDGDWGEGECVAASVVTDSASGDVIVKLVNKTPRKVTTHVTLSGAEGLDSKGQRTVLVGDPKATNDQAHPERVVPVTDKFAVSDAFDCESPPNSLTVLRMKRAGR
jgi:alpha-N-arabinofuranosidase